MKKYGFLWGALLTTLCVASDSDLARAHWKLPSIIKCISTLSDVKVSQSDTGISVKGTVKPDTHFCDISSSLSNGELHLSFFLSEKASVLFWDVLRTRQISYTIG